jgi:colicin import membrane protein
MAKPGVVLRRPVGSNGPFTEHAELPKNLPVETVKARPAKPQKEPPARNIDSKAARAAALAFEREQKRREMKRRKEEAAREKERKRREQVIAKAKRVLEQAKREPLEHEALTNYVTVFGNVDLSAVPPSSRGVAVSASVFPPDARA